MRTGGAGADMRISSEHPRAGSLRAGARHSLELHRAQGAT
jgi:hypothetical protein